MRKYSWIGIGILVVVIGLLATPTVLRAIPDRYVARYLPEPLQEIASPGTDSPILPTVVPMADVSALLETAPTATAVIAPPTLTPVGPEEENETAVVQSSPTPIPTATIPPTPTSTPLPQTVRLDGIQHQFQDWNNCGPATLAMTLSYFDLNLTQSDTAAFLKPNPEDRNVTPQEMARFVNETTDLKALTRVNGNIDTVKQLVAAGVPVVLEIGIDPPGEYQWMGWYGHYLLVVAYDDLNEQFFVYDSWLGTSDVPGANADREGRNLSYAEIDVYWPQFNRNYIVVYRPEQETAVFNIIGENLDDEIMWRNNLAVVQQEAAKDPNNPFYWFNLGTVYNALGNYEQAAAAFDQARTIGLPWRMLWYQFGPYEAYMNVGRFEDVILLADVTLKNRPYFEESFYYRGLAYQATGNLEQAQRDLRAANNFNPNFAPAATALAELSE